MRATAGPTARRRGPPTAACSHWTRHRAAVDQDGPALVAIYAAAADGTPFDSSARHHPDTRITTRRGLPTAETVVFERDQSSDPAGPSQLMAVDVASRAERPLRPARLGAERRHPQVLTRWHEDPLRLLVRLRRPVPGVNPERSQLAAGNHPTRRQRPPHPASRGSARQRQLVTRRRAGRLPLPREVGGVDFKLCTSKLEGPGSSGFRGHSNPRTPAGDPTSRPAQSSASAPAARRRPRRSTGPSRCIHGVGVYKGVYQPLGDRTDRSLCAPRFRPTRCYRRTIALVWLARPRYRVAAAIAAAVAIFAFRAPACGAVWIRRLPAAGSRRRVAWSTPPSGRRGEPLCWRSM